MSAAAGQAAAAVAGDALAGGASPSAAWRELLLRVRRQPGWVGASAAALTAAGLAAIPQATLLAHVLAGAFLEGRGRDALAASLAALVLVVGLRALLEGAAAHAGTRAADTLTRDLRTEVTGRLLAQGPAYLEGQRTGALGADVLEGADRVGAVAGRFLPQAASCAILPVTIAAYAFRLDPLSGAILLVTGPLIPFFMWLLGGLAEARAQRQWRALGLLSAQALDALQGLETLRLYGRERDHERALARVGERYRRTTLDVLRVAFLSGFALELLAMLGTAMVAVSVGLRLATGGLAFPIALTTLLLAPEFYLPFRRLGAHHHAAMEGMAALRGLAAHLAPRAHDVGRPTDAWEPEAVLAARPPGTPVPALHARRPAAGDGAHGPRVRLIDVSASYPGRASPALRGVSLELAPGGMTALVGHSGSGKSSVARLLIGTLEAERGQLLADGAVIHPARSESWRSRLAFVPQQPHLFAGSVLANLRLARPSATFAEVVEAARRAEADGFIRALPGGYGTLLGEDGLDLSGGERHRLAIARAFLRDADMVVLDEITAYLDAATEAELAQAIARLAERSTLLVIAHRLETVRRAGHIVVLEAGEVVEEGRHPALLARDGVYAGLAGKAGSSGAPLGVP